LARKILLADDSVTAQNMGRKILADAGYEVITVNNGSAALKKIAEQKPDLIVLDVYMPGYSGLEVCQRLKEVKETARIPVLLTVGKLEPFKPEEARRVRAEGYIVKPFEASELLSALSKLEDRVVPRAESAKPGRFARAIAAVEEGRGDETAEANDSADDGWKSRIGFPSKKKKKQEEDEAEAYKPVDRDLRTVVERPAPREMSPSQEGRLDVAALAAAAGLPKDVTPEELAALAAAAAQVQAAVDGREPAAAPPQSSFEATSPVEEKAEAKVEAKVEATSEAKIETPIESKSKSQPEAQAVPQNAQSEVSEKAEGATFAQQGADEAAAANVTPKESKPAAAVRDFDVIAAPAETEKKNAEEKHSDEAVVPVTMAAAAVAGAAYVSVGSTTHRWTAVPVAIAAEEAAVSLELEMQKAYAAFAAAEANQPGFVASPPATPVVESSISAAMVEAPAGPVPDEEEIARTLRDVAQASTEAVDSALAKLEAVAEANANTVPGVTQAEESSPKPGETHTEIVAAAIRDLEAKRELEAKELETKELEAREREAREREAQEVEAKEREAREREAKEMEAREREARENEAKQAEAREREAREREAKEIEAREQEAREREAQEAGAREREAREREAQEAEAREREAREREAKEIEAREREAREREAQEAEARGREAREREAKEIEAREREAREQAEAEAAAAAAAAQAAAEAVAAVSGAPEPGKEKIAGGEMAEKRESDIAATTAAAWASWRQIRETGDKSKATGPAKAGQDDDDEEYPELPPDRAAMAAAAGAEKSPSAEETPEASADDPEAIANIVDKVLADLRPKIAEEISKKLKKK
jgi:CheY-like chemotaxis protein